MGNESDRKQPAASDSDQPQQEDQTDLNAATFAGEEAPEARPLPSGTDLNAATLGGDASSIEQIQSDPDLNAATFTGGEAPPPAETSPSVDLNAATFAGQEPDRNATQPPVDLNAGTFTGGQGVPSDAGPPIDLNAATFTGGDTGAGTSSDVMPSSVDLNSATLGPADASVVEASGVDLSAKTMDGPIESSGVDLGAKTMDGPVSLQGPADLTAATLAGPDIDLQAATLAGVDDSVQKEWAATITDDLTEGMTIKGDEKRLAKQKTSTSTHITVNERQLVDHTKLTDEERERRAHIQHRSVVSKDKSGRLTRGADYELIDVLGEGGMGIVYRARQSAIDRSIAIKMIKSGAATDTSARDKFLFEAAVTGDLDHPNIVPIHDLGDDGTGSLFYSMKHVKGEPWCDVIKDKTLAENLEILDDVSNAIAFAHDRGVIHRDLKPENIMLGGYGEVLVMDWGLAAAWKPSGKAVALQAKTTVCGTPAYMSPEMAVGDGTKIGPVSDVYLLGAILFEAVTGVPPHTGATVLRCLENAATNVIRETEAHGELIDIACKAMATEVEERYQTVGELQEAIKQYQSHYESISLAERAQSDLKNAQGSGEYDDYNKAVFGFQEALNLWKKNKQADEGLSEARLAYAETALGKGDLDLADSQLVEMTKPFRELRNKVMAERVVREKREKHLATAKKAGMVAAAVFLIGITVFIYLINEKSKEAQKQSRLAREAATTANIEKKKAQASAKEATEALAQARKSRLQQELEEARAGKLQDSSRWAMKPEDAAKAREKAAEDFDLKLTQEIALPEASPITFSLIPPGLFTMGSPQTEEGRSDEESLHNVKFDQPFYMATHEMRRDQWASVVRATPDSGLEPNPNSLNDASVTARYPVESVSYNDIKKFMPLLQKYAPEGFQVSLPSEAEWEYAARTGTPTAYYFGDDQDQLKEHGWFGGLNSNADKKPHPVGLKSANTWGLYDMHGNVAELCEDTHEPDYYLQLVNALIAEAKDKAKDTAWLPVAINPVNRAEGRLRVVRGGAFWTLPKHCRSAHRANAEVNLTMPFMGFRVVLRKKQ